MRFFAFMLSIFILTMALMPCDDAIEYTIFQNESLIQFENHSHDHPQGEADGCTPFCICTCCGASVDIPSVTELIVIKKKDFAELCSNYVLNYSFDFIEGIWHPPSIS